MRIREILSQHRRDFRAIFECEHCGAEDQRSGYDDTNFHENVIPALCCSNCGLAADAERYRPLKTKYPEGVQV